LKEISQLKNIIMGKSQLIEEERKRLEDLRSEFNKRLEERQFLEDEILKNSMHIPERMVENSEKAGLYQKIQSLRLQINKMKGDYEKMKKQVEEAKGKYKEVDDKRQKLSDENKSLLNVQVNDQKIISSLRKEKEELKEKLKELKLKNEIASKTNPEAGSNVNVISGEGVSKIEESQIALNVNQSQGDLKRGNSKSKVGYKYTMKSPDIFRIDKKGGKIVVKPNPVPQEKVVITSESNKDSKTDEKPEGSSTISKGGEQAKQFNINY